VVFPYSQRIYDKLAVVVISAMIQASVKKEGMSNGILGDCVVLLATAPRPYTSVISALPPRKLRCAFCTLRWEEAEKWNIANGSKKGFRQAMNTGLDIFFGLALILGKMGERYANGSGGMKIDQGPAETAHHGTALRGFHQSQAPTSPAYIPKDIWKLKGS
jgi:hypothetical protein